MTTFRGVGLVCLMWLVVLTASGQFVDVGGSVNPAAAVLQWPMNGGGNQRWQLARVG